MSRSKAFRLEIDLATPLVLNHPWMHLDSLIGHLIRQRLGGPHDLATFVPARDGLVRHSVWCRTITRTGPLNRASVSFIRPYAPKSISYYHRFEEDGFPGKRKLPLGHGHFRLWRLTWIYLPASRVVFYGLGKPELVKDLFADLESLGNDTRVGWGKVHAWRLVREERDRSTVADGRAQRPIPVRFCRRWSDSAVLTWQPPYWDTSRAEECVVPGAEVTVDWEVLKGAR